MGSKVDVVRSFIDASWSDPPASVIKANQDYLADNFQGFNQDGVPTMNKETYINVTRLFLAAFADLKWVLRDFRLVGDGVLMSGHYEGTHTGDLDLSAMGLEVVKASGDKIIWPEALLVYKVEGDKIISERAYAGASGLDELLAPLGVKLPVA